jgi:hypothetical protein
MKIEVIFNQEPTFPRFVRSQLLINGEQVPAATLDIYLGAESEYLMIKIPLQRVEIRSEPSEPSKSLDSKE